MKKTFLLITLLFMPFLTKAQSITPAQYAKYDTNKDGLVTLRDVTLLVNMMNASATLDPSKVDVKNLRSLTGEVVNFLLHDDGSYVPVLEYVDLGLSVKWATCNLGASEPYQAGLYYAWGETTGYKSNVSDGRLFNWTSYKWMMEDVTTWRGVTKYTLADNQVNGCWYSAGEYVGSTIDGTTYKNLSQLLEEDDAACQEKGGDWRMPTASEQSELRMKCYWVWTDSYKSTGVAGNIVYKRLDKDNTLPGEYAFNNSTCADSYNTSCTHIFLPAVGCRTKGNIVGKGEFGYYWSSTLNPAFSDRAYSSKSGDRICTWEVTNRYYGFCIRPVLDQGAAAKQHPFDPDMYGMMIPVDLYEYLMEY